MAKSGLPTAASTAVLCTVEKARATSVISNVVPVVGMGGASAFTSTVSLA
ncbi:hypothetical protein ACFQX6_47220 [Streptosporangium lutulentum]